MSNTKSNSTMICIPFAWEKVPGVPKFVVSPTRTLAPELNDNHYEVKRKMGLPLPPGCFKQPVRRASKRMFMWEEDPFLAAMIVCTKDYDKHKGKGEMKNSFATRVHMNYISPLLCVLSFNVFDDEKVDLDYDVTCKVRGQQQ
ncbi:hypothetical protein QVD17_04857 [Tagetes erecta]|uniref:Uncharacterized protein n=1 Tax=Tagetes erecta TaxID=13708 RepID=A0AAD8LCQ2_TARER|nr:hypothetical protein QVD17_04857 [Tagetes erecta]